MNINNIATNSNRDITIILEEILGSIKRDDFETLSCALEEFELSIGIRQYVNIRKPEFLNVLGVKTIPNEFNIFRKKDIVNNLKQLQTALLIEDTHCPHNDNVVIGNYATARLIADNIHTNDFDKTILELAVIRSIFNDIVRLSNRRIERNGTELQVYDLLYKSERLEFLMNKYDAHLTQYILNVELINEIHSTTLFGTNSGVFYVENLCKKIVNSLTYSVPLEMVSVIASHIYKQHLESDAIFMDKLLKFKNELIHENPHLFITQPIKETFTDMFALYIIFENKDVIISKFSESIFINTVGFKSAALKGDTLKILSIIKTFYDCL